MGVDSVINEPAGMDVMAMLLMFEFHDSGWRF